MIVGMGESPPNRRRWLQFSLGTLFVVLTVVGLAAALVAWGNRPHPFPDPDKEIKEVELAMGDGSAPVRLRITDPALIQTLVATPLHRSRRDWIPKFYLSLGTLYVTYADGSVADVWAFSPWGRYKYYDEYRVADFSSLRDECHRLLLESSDPNATKFLNDARLWR